MHLGDSFTCQFDQVCPLIFPEACDIEHESGPFAILSLYREASQILQRIQYFAIVSDEALQCLIAFSFGNNCHQSAPMTNIKVYVSDRKSTRLNSSHVAISYAVF